MQKLPPFKAGDTFSLSCIYKDDAGNPASMSAFTITSQIRTLSGLTLVADLVCIPDNVNVGHFVLVPTNSNTFTWPIAQCVCDIKITQGTTIVSSDTFLIPVIQEVTQ